MDPTSRTRQYPVIFCFASSLLHGARFLTMDSALGFASSALLPSCCTVRVFRQKSTLDDAIGSHACSLQANMRVTNAIRLGSPLLLPVATVNCVRTLKAADDFFTNCPTGDGAFDACQKEGTVCAFSDRNSHSRIKRVGVSSNGIIECPQSIQQRVTEFMIA
jgi:hypothetical protein